jgi:hypothetical protein
VIVPGTLTVARVAATDIGHREVFVALDGRSLAILRHGETVTKEVEPAAINKAGWGTYSVLAWIGAGPIYLTFERAG